MGRLALSIEYLEGRAKMLTIKENQPKVLNNDVNGQEIDITEEMDEIIRLTYKILQKREQTSKLD